MANTYDLPVENCEDRIIAPEVPCATHNVCVLSIDSYMWRIGQEMVRNVSSRVTAFSDDDIARIASYYDKLVALINATSTTIADFHFLVEFKLSPLLTELPMVENDTVNAVLNYLLGANVNMRISQSARLNDALLDQDRNDLLDAISKSRALFEAMVQNFNPQDMPQSSPSQPVVEPTL